MEVGGDEQGVVRFDTAVGYAADRVGAEDYIDLNIGLDCRLYALRSDSVTTQIVDVYDPLTLAPLGSISLELLQGTIDVRGIAVDANGELYGASWDGNIYHFDASGMEIDSLDSLANDLTDINLRDNGDLVVGARLGDVVFTTTALNSITDSFVVNSAAFGVFVEWVGVEIGDSCTREIFTDGFESGDTTAWSGSVP
jgi:hypothetical protein